MLVFLVANWAKFCYNLEQTKSIYLFLDNMVGADSWPLKPHRKVTDLYRWPTATGLVAFFKSEKELLLNAIAHGASQFLQIRLGI